VFHAILILFFAHST